MSQLTSTDGPADGRRPDALALFRGGFAPATRSRRLRLRLDLGIQRRGRLPGGNVAGVSAAGTERLMELPLSIMDSALFYPDRMDRLQPDAMHRRAVRSWRTRRRFGGTVVINWHDRSLAPERLWDRLLQATPRRSRKGRSCLVCDRRRGRGLVPVATFDSFHVRHELASGHGDGARGTPGSACRPAANLPASRNKRSRSWRNVASMAAHAIGVQL